MENKLFIVSYWIDERGLDGKVREIEDVKETDKSFVTDGKRISKDKLMKIDTIYYENHKSIRYHTYCREGEQDKALEMLKQHVIKKVYQYRNTIDNLITLVIKHG